MPGTRKLSPKLQVEDLLARTSCSICKQTLHKPATIGCGHYFCHACVLKVSREKRNPTCPTCKKPFSVQKICVNNAISKIYSKIETLIQDFKEKARKKDVSSATQQTPKATPCRSRTKTTEARVTTTPKEMVVSKRRTRTSVAKSGESTSSSIAISPYKVNNDKVTTWLKDTTCDAIPTQDRSYVSPLIEASPLLSVSQVDHKKLPVYMKSVSKEPQTSKIDAKIDANKIDPFEYVPSQPDSIVKVGATKRLSLTKPKITYGRKPTKQIEEKIDKSDEPEMLLFYSQSEEYIKKQDEKRLKEIESSDEIIEEEVKKKRKRKVISTPTTSIDLETQLNQKITEAENFDLVIEKSPPTLSSVKPRKMISKQADTEKELHLLTEPTIMKVTPTEAEYLSKVSRKTKISSSPQKLEKQITEADDLAIGKSPSILSSIKPSKTISNQADLIRKRRLSTDVRSVTTIAERTVVKATSTETENVSKKSEIQFSSSPGFSRIKKMRSDFKSPARKSALLNVSTNSIPHPPSHTAKEVAVSDRASLKIDSSSPLMEKSTRRSQKIGLTKTKSNDEIVPQDDKMQVSLSESMNSSMSSLGPPNYSAVAQLENAVEELEKDLMNTSNVLNKSTEVSIDTQGSICFVENSVPMDVEFTLPPSSTSSITSSKTMTKSSDKTSTQSSSLNKSKISIPKTVITEKLSDIDTLEKEPEIISTPKKGLKTSTPKKGFETPIIKTIPETLTSKSGSEISTPKEIHSKFSSLTGSKIARPKDRSEISTPQKEYSVSKPKTGPKILTSEKEPEIVTPKKVLEPTVTMKSYEVPPTKHGAKSLSLKRGPKTSPSPKVFEPEINSEVIKQNSISLTSEGTISTMKSPPLHDVENLTQRNTQMSQTAVNLLEHIHQLQGVKRKTFLLESNTDEAMSEVARVSTQSQLVVINEVEKSTISQKTQKSTQESLMTSSSNTETTVIQMEQRTKPLSVHVAKFVKQGSLRLCDRSSLPLVKFKKLGYLNPQLKGKRFVQPVRQSWDHFIHSLPFFNVTQRKECHCKSIQTSQVLSELETAPKMVTASVQTSPPSEKMASPKQVTTCSIQTSQPMMATTEVQTSQPGICDELVQTSPIELVTRSVQWSPQSQRNQSNPTIFSSHDRVTSLRQVEPRQATGYSHDCNLFKPSPMLFSEDSTSQSTFVSNRSEIRSPDSFKSAVTSHSEPLTSQSLDDEGEITVIEKSQEPVKIKQQKSFITTPIKNVENITENDSYSIDSGDVLQASISQPVLSPHLEDTAQSECTVDDEDEVTGSRKSRKRDRNVISSDSEGEVTPKKRLSRSRSHKIETVSIASSGSSIRALVKSDLAFAKAYAAHITSSNSSIATITLDGSPTMPVQNSDEEVKSSTTAVQATEISEQQTSHTINKSAGGTQSPRTKPTEAGPSQDVIELVDSGNLLERNICEDSDSESDMFLEGTPKQKKTPRELEVKTPPLPVEPPQPISICYSGLSPESVKVVDKFLARFKQVQHSSIFLPTTTHVIVPHDDSMCTNSTLKYLMAVCCGRWVVSEKWVTGCLEADRLIPEEPFEMLDSNACPGPRRSRLSPHRLFHEFEIHFGDKPEAYAQVTLQQMQDMVTCSGGKLINFAGLGLPQERKYRIIIIPSFELPPELQGFRNPIISLDWVVESIEQFRLAPVCNNVARTIDDLLVIEQGFPAEMLESTQDESNTTNSTTTTQNH